MKKIILTSIITSSILLASDYNYEVTPLVGYVNTKDHVDIKNHVVTGVAVARSMDEDCKIDKLELGLLQSTEYADYENSVATTPITRLFFNGIKEYKIDDKFDLYALAGLGYEHIDNEEFNNNSDGFFNYGVGMKYGLTKNLSLKIDARHLLKTDGDKNIVYTVGVGIPFGNTSKKIVEKEPIVEVKKIVEKKVVELDTDNDGVKDSIDKCPTTKAGIKVDSNGCEVINIPANLGLEFEINSDKIQNTDIVKFDKYVNYLQKVPSAKIILEAHTDSVGDAKYNLELSQRRALSTKAQLVSMGIDERRIEAVGYGETKPLVANDSESNKQINRRVTARIVK